MPLTEEQEDRVVAWLQSHHTQSCAVCGGDSWSILDLVALPLMGDSGVVESVFSSDFNFKTSPSVQVVCDNCQHILLFSAQGIGIM